MCLSAPDIGLEEVDDGIWFLYFYDVLLGWIVEGSGATRSGYQSRTGSSLSREVRSGCLHPLSKYLHQEPETSYSKTEPSAVACSTSIANHITCGTCGVFLGHNVYDLWHWCINPRTSDCAISIQ